MALKKSTEVQTILGEKISERNLLYVRKEVKKKHRNKDRDGNRQDG